MEEKKKYKDEGILNIVSKSIRFFIIPAKIKQRSRFF